MSLGNLSLAHSQLNHPWNLLIYLSFLCAPTVSWTFSHGELPRLITLPCLQICLLLMDSGLPQRGDTSYLLHIPSSQPGVCTL